MSLLDRLRFLLVTSCGLGLSPFAPGTVGTLGGVVLGLLLQLALAPAHVMTAYWVAAAVLFVLGCMQTDFVKRTFRGEDPGAYVLDEVIGYLVTLALWMALTGEQPNALAHAGAFFLFRVFDVLKVQPCRRLEDLPGALGILADDVMAGVYAGLALWLCMPFFGT